MVKDSQSTMVAVVAFAALLILGSCVGPKKDGDGTAGKLNNDAHAALATYKNLYRTDLHNHNLTAGASWVEVTDQLCPCVGEDQIPRDRNEKGEVLLPFWKAALGKDFERPKDFGTKCHAWDEGTAPLCDEAEYKRVAAEGLHWAGDAIKKMSPEDCAKPWCFVSKECACGDAIKDKYAKMKVEDAFLTQAHEGPFPEWSFSGIYFSYLNCDKSNAEMARKHVDEYCKMHPTECNSEKLKCSSEEEGQELEQATAAAHDAKPTRARVEEAEEWMRRTSNRVAAAKAVQEHNHKELLAIQQIIEAQDKQIQDFEAVDRKAKDEVASLAEKLAAEPVPKSDVRSISLKIGVLVVAGASWLTQA